MAAHPNRASQGGGVLVGRNRFFFAAAAPPVPLGGGLQAWRGFYSSVRPSHSQLMVNVNGKHPQQEIAVITNILSQYVRLHSTVSHSSSLVPPYL